MTLDLDEIERIAASNPGGGLLVSNTIPALVAEVKRLNGMIAGYQHDCERYRGRISELEAENWEAGRAREALDEALTLLADAIPDPYTMSARLCDDHGMVSHERVTDQRPGELPDVTYLGRFNIMRVVHHQEKPLAEPFFCTGSAHIAGQHILCTSPAHDKPRNWVAALDGGPDPANIFDGNGSNVTDRALARAAARLRKIAKRADDYTPAGLRIMLYYEADHLAEAAARPKPEKPAVHDLADPVCSQHEPERGDWGHCDTCAAIDGAGQENQQ